MRSSKDHHQFIIDRDDTSELYPILVVSDADPTPIRHRLAYIRCAYSARTFGLRYGHTSDTECPRVIGHRSDINSKDIQCPMFSTDIFASHRTSPFRTPNVRSHRTSSMSDIECPTVNTVNFHSRRTCPMSDIECPTVIQYSPRTKKKKFQ